MVLLAVAFCGPGIFPVDFGVLFDGQFDAATNDGTERSGSLLLAPWFSAPLGTADFFVSVGMNAKYNGNWFLVPELLRLELAARPSSLFAVRAGRIFWEDPSLFTAWGLFDGAELFFDLGKSQLGVAALYTGLLYKNRALVNFSPGEDEEYNAELDWGDFKNSYFAYRRLLAALYGEFPGLPYKRGQLYAGVLAQFDLGDAEKPYNTQYAFLRNYFSYSRFDLSLTGAAELQTTDEDGQKPAFAASIEGGVKISYTLQDRLSLGLRWASGEGPQTAAFFPITREAQGEVLRPALSGIMVARANYEAYPFSALKTELGGRYFFRTDSGSFEDKDIENDSYLLGAEVDASLVWGPFSDLSFLLSGGIFMPKTGKAMRSDANVRWFFSLETIFSF